MLQAMWCAQTCFKPCSSPVLGTVLPTPLRCCAARVCVCRPQTRVHCQELGRLEIADGYASCLAWSPALSSLSPLSSVSTPCGYLAAASSSAHTLIVPFSLSGPPLQAESLAAPLPDAAQSGARRHGVVPLLPTWCCAVAAQQGALRTISTTVCVCVLGRGRPRRRGGLGHGCRWCVGHGCRWCGRRRGCRRLPGHVCGVVLDDRLGLWSLFLACLHWSPFLACLHWSPFLACLPSLAIALCSRPWWSPWSPWSPRS